MMTNVGISIGLLLMLCSAASADEWRVLLEKPVDEHWKEIVGVGLNQTKARPAETLGDKIKAIQTLIADDYNGQTIPVVLDSEIADWELPAIPKTPENEFRIGQEIMRVPAVEVFRYLCQLNQLKLKVEEDGLKITKRRF